MKTILEEAQALVDGDRREDYGDLEKSFKRIADLWTAYLYHISIDNIMTYNLSPNDVAMMMILLKMAREMAGHKRDSLVDIAGYAYCASKLAGDNE